jgi:hypothetical protein
MAIEQMSLRATLLQREFPHLENLIEKRNLMFKRKYQDKRELHSQQKQ